MKTWVWMLVIVAGGYLIYNTWFDPDVEDEPGEPPVTLEVPVDPKGDPEPKSQEQEAKRRIDLDVGGGAATRTLPSEDPAVRALEKQRREALDRGDQAQARRVAARIVKEHPDSDAARWAQFEQGRVHLGKYRDLGKSKEGFVHARLAWRLLTPALFVRDVEAAERETLIEELDKLAQDLLFARHVEGIDWIYKPKSGDALIRLCRRTFRQRGSRVSPGFVAAVNGMSSPSELRAGEPIRVPLGEVRIVVVKNEFLMYFLLNDCFVRAFPVGLGREGGTPTASFVVGKKLKNPDWFPRPGVKVPYGHPENILGTRWLGFKNTAEYRGFGIHGTVDPASIGKEESSGCVRMLRSDVETLYDWTPSGTVVEIRR